MERATSGSSSAIGTPWGSQGKCGTRLQVQGWTGISAWPDAKALCPARSRTLRGASHTAAAAVVLLQKSVLNLRVDFVEPLSSAFSFILINSNLSLHLRDPIFGRAKLMRELLGHVESVFAVRFGHACGLVQQLQNGLPGLIELIRVIRSRIFRCKWNYGFC